VSSVVSVVTLFTYLVHCNDLTSQSVIMNGMGFTVIWFKHPVI
jgi:hypothetical protein